MIISFIQQYLSGSSIGEVIMFAVITITALMFSLTVHECAHGYAAYKCGDDTAYINGRLSLNPFAHLDPLGALSLLLVGFGWAKPVPVNYRRLKKPRRDIALVSLAGPLSNILLAAVLTCIYTLIEAFAPAFSPLHYVGLAFYLGAALNVGLAVFNLIPLPPLDGSKILSCLLPPLVAAKYLMFEKYFKIILLVLIIGGRLPFIGGIVDKIWFPIDFIRYGIIDLLYKMFISIWSLF